MRSLFSGRFDPPHPGHIASILRLEKKGPVTVVILDYPERSYPLEYVRTIFSEIFEKHDIKVVTNKTHFAEIDKKEFLSFKCDKYASGNLTVLKHIEELGVPVIYCDRAYEYSARNIKRVLD